MVMEYYDHIMQTFQVATNGLEPWEYDPRRNAEMPVDILGYVGIIVPQKISKRLVSYWVQGPKVPMHIFPDEAIYKCNAPSGHFYFPSDTCTDTTLQITG